MHQTAISTQRFNQPPIPLICPKTGEKIKLKLRKMSFCQEISEISSDMQELLAMIIGARKDKNESIYNLVAAWNKIRIFSEYWKTFNFRSEAEFLVYYDLPDGTTLGALTVMVNFFDRQTFVLLGQEVLSYMMRLIGTRTSDLTERKEAYQEIFDRYCRTNDAFDKTKFYELVRRFVAQKYPEEKYLGTATRKPCRSGNSQKIHTPEQSARRTVVEVSPSIRQTSTIVQNDFQWETQECPGCKQKIKALDALIDYVKKLEAYIENNEKKSNNAQQISRPKRPAQIESLLT